MTTGYYFYVYLGTENYFVDLGEAIAVCLRQNGIEALVSTFLPGPRHKDHQLVVLGANNIKFCKLPVAIPDRAVILNFEQLSDASPFNTSEYLELMKKHGAWDHSHINVAWLSSKGITAKLFPFGFSPSFVFRTPELEEEDIDVLFYGSRNDRRDRLMEELKRLPGDRKISFHINNLWGLDREQTIRRAKIVVNLHSGAGGHVESPRIFMALSNKKCVVSERGINQEEYRYLEEGVAWFPDGDAKAFYAAVEHYLTHPDERKAIGEKGYQVLSERPCGVPL